MTNEEMLALIRADQPNKVINEVKSFEVNEHGFYDVIVDMDMNAFGTLIKHTTVKLPYPFKGYEDLTDKQQFEWRWKM